MDAEVGRNASGGDLEMTSTKQHLTEHGASLYPELTYGSGAMTVYKD